MHKKKYIKCHHERLLRVNVFTTESVVRELIAELKRCYEEMDALRSIVKDWVKIEAFTDDGKGLIVDMEDEDGNCFSGYINRTSE